MIRENHLSSVEELGSPPASNLLGPHARLYQVASLCNVAWMCAWAVIAFFRPRWYKELGNDRRRRNYVVGIVIGIFFKFLSVPSCALAAYKTPAEDDVAGIRGYMNEHQQICWGSRGVTIILELYHFIGHTELMIHHGLVLVTMIVIGIFNGPHRGLDLSLGALVSEFPSVTFSIIRGLGLLGKYPTLERGLIVVGTGLILAVRVPAMFICMAMLPESGLRGGPSRVVLMAYSFYLVYNLHLSWRRLKRAQIWQSWQTGDGHWDFRIRVTTRFMVSSAGFMAGLAAVGLLVSALAFFSMFEFATKDRLMYATGLLVPALLLAVQTLQQYETFHRCFTSAAQQFVSVKMPKLGTLSKCTVMLWMLYILGLASVGEVPEEHNKHLNPVDVMARSVPLCKLIMTWYFWFCASLALLFPMFMVRSQTDTQVRGTDKAEASGRKRT